MVKKLNESKLERDYYVKQVANYRKYIEKIRDLLPELETAYDDMQQYLEDNDVSQSYLQEADLIITNVMKSWSDLDRAELAASQIIGRYGKSGRLVRRESKSRTKKRSIKEEVCKPQYYDQELEQFEISFITHGKDGQDEIRDYVDSRRDTGIFGSIGSEYNNISVWVNTEDIDDTFVNEVEDLIDFAQDRGARLNVKCFNELKDLFTVKHAPYDI